MSFLDEVLSIPFGIAILIRSNYIAACLPPYLEECLDNGDGF
jgi:hypothetical protein